MFPERGPALPLIGRDDSGASKDGLCLPVIARRSQCFTEIRQRKPVLRPRLCSPAECGYSFFHPYAGFVRNSSLVQHHPQLQLTTDILRLFLQCLSQVLDFLGSAPLVLEIADAGVEKAKT